ncbi:MAG: hypothetical protein WBA45_07725 [Microthrixaceae bacterium]
MTTTAVAAELSAPISGPIHRSMSCSLWTARWYQALSGATLTGTELSGTNWPNTLCPHYVYSGNYGNPCAVPDTGWG